ncbi:hypothetical protein PMAYCL1PPCAC_32232, partial [Pristionchus mayeri]
LSTRHLPTTRMWARNRQQTRKMHYDDTEQGDKKGFESNDVRMAQNENENNQSCKSNDVRMWLRENNDWQALRELNRKKRIEESRNHRTYSEGAANDSDRPNYNEAMQKGRNGYESNDVRLSRDIDQRDYESNDVRRAVSREQERPVPRDLNRHPSPREQPERRTYPEDGCESDSQNYKEDFQRGKSQYESNDVRMSFREQNDRPADRCRSSNRRQSYREPVTRAYPESADWGERSPSPSLHHYEMTAAPASASYSSPPWIARVALTGLCKADDDHVISRAKFIRNNGWDCVESDKLREKLKAAFPRVLPLEEVGLAVIQEGLDLIVRGPRGYGRTTTWMVPIIDKMMGYKRERGELHTLVVAASEGTANYTASTLTLLLPREQENSKAVWHWKKSSIQHNYDEMEKFGADILITTSNLLPSLLVDAVFDVSKLQAIVFEEVDHMTEAGNRDWIVKVCSYLNKGTQTILVSSPMCSNMDKAVQLLKKPYATVNINHIRAEYEPMTSFFSAQDKDGLGELLQILRVFKGKKAVAVFFSDDKRVARFYDLLRERGVSNVSCLHSRLDSHEGWSNDLSAFREGHVDVLLCTYWKEL